MVRLRRYNMVEISINFYDLKEEVQKEVLKLAGVKDPADLNWDVWPMCVFEINTDEDEEV